MLKTNIKKIKYINRRWRYQVYKVVLDIYDCHLKVSHAFPVFYSHFFIITSIFL